MKTLPVLDFASKLISCNLHPKKKEMLRTFYGSPEVREFIGVLGRRSGKDLLAVIMSLYEAHRLIGKSDPYKYYNMPSGNPICILCLSVSADQSKILFQEMKHSLQESKFITELFPYGFKIEHNYMDFYTADKKSIRLVCDHSNSDALLGKRYFAIIFNELASFKNADRLFTALSPVTMDFRKDGFIDSHIIVLSSSRSTDHLLWRLCTEMPSERLVYHLATWEARDDMDEKTLRQENKYMSTEEFECEFGTNFRKNDNNQTISLRLSSHQIDDLKRLARQRAYKQDIDINYTDLIRESISQYLESNIA